MRRIKYELGILTIIWNRFVKALMKIIIMIVSLYVFCQNNLLAIVVFQFEMVEEKSDL